MSKVLPKLDNTNLWDKTYNILKERILLREFGPNEKLSIPELSDQLGISRTPIRDALNRLEMEGLVKTVSKIGTFVNAIDAPMIHEIMDTRLMLEYWIVNKISVLTKQEIGRKTQKMERILEQSAEMMSKATLEEYLKSDFNLQFHLAFMQIGGNNRNIDIYKSLMNYRMLANFITWEMVQSAFDQHRKIITAMKDGSADDMRQVIKLHLDDSKDRLLDRISAKGGLL